MPYITLIRGLPGSGKTTLALELAAETGAVHNRGRPVLHAS